MNHGPQQSVVAFKPSSAAEAKAFLLQVASQLPPGSVKVSADTPRTSRLDKWQGRPDTMLCHGCHGPMGDGAHNGSAIGKNLCTLEHNPACQGGVRDDPTWRACPPNHVYQGFEQTLSSQDFRPPIAMFKFAFYYQLDFLEVTIFLKN